MQYEVRALSADHVLTALRLDAISEEDARLQAEQRGFFAASVKPLPRRPLLHWRRKSSGSRHFSLVLFSQELLALLHAGLSIVEGLDALLEKETHETPRAILTRLLCGLREGKRFSQALGEQPALFPDLYIGIIKAAEGSSDLPRSLARFIDYQQRLDIVRSKIISAAIYPLILLAVGGAVTFFLIGYVVPRFAQVYQGTGRSLPWLSQLLLDWGRFIGTHSTVLLAGITAGLVALFCAVRQFSEQGGLARLMRALPAIGERVRLYQLSRLYLTLGMLLEGGIPIVTAMQTVTGIASPTMKAGLLSAREDIQCGTQLSIAFEVHGLSTPISLRMLRVGERSGELGKMLMQSAAFYDGEINRWTDRFTRSFEPLLMTAIGLVVGLIVVLLYMPIFDLAGSLS